LLCGQFGYNVPVGNGPSVLSQISTRQPEDEKRMARRSRLRDSYLERNERERDALRARLCRDLGTEQFRELLLGKLSPDADWRGWCNRILARHPDVVTRLQHEALRAEELEQRIATPLRDLGTDMVQYWDEPGEDSAFAQWMRERVDAGELTSAQAKAVTGLREARLARFISLPALARDPADASQHLVLQHLLRGSQTEQWGAANAILASANGVDRLMAAIPLVPNGALITVAQVALSQERRLRPRQAAVLLQNLQDQVEDRWLDDRESRSSWLRAAWALLPPLSAVRVCLLELGHPVDDPVRHTVLQLLSDATPDQQQIILSALERWMDLVEAAMADDVAEPPTGQHEVRWTREFVAIFSDPAERIRASAWLRILDLTCPSDGDLPRPLVQAIGSSSKSTYI
jgi:hypothetical protein